MCESRYLFFQVCSVYLWECVLCYHNKLCVVYDLPFINTNLYLSIMSMFWTFCDCLSLVRCNICVNVYVADLRNCAGQVSRSPTGQVCRQQCYKLDVSQFCRWTSFRNTAYSNLLLYWRDTLLPTSMASAGKDTNQSINQSSLFLASFLFIEGWLCCGFAVQ